MNEKDVASVLTENLKQKYGVLNHRLLWMAACENLAAAKEKAEDAFLFNMAAMVMGYFAFEGYLNWLGALIVPEVWKDERHFFNKKPFCGTIGKYHYLMKTADQPIPEPAQRPYLNLTHLSDLRNTIAHCRPEIGERNIGISQETGQPDDYEPYLLTNVTPENAQQALEDVQQLLRVLHEGARKHYEVPYAEPFGKMWSWSCTSI
jgi:hypothetical protein